MFIVVDSRIPLTLSRRRRTGFALSVGSLGAFLGGSAQAALLSEKWIWARPVGLFAVSFIRFTRSHKFLTRFTSVHANPGDWLDGICATSHDD
jgi:hypothetical protein